MSVSVVIISKDEAPRLRLVLESLIAESSGAGAEVVVVDDGSTDPTPQVLAEYAGVLPLRTVRHDSPRGRSGARNVGARAATGDVLLFLDGDCLAGPGLIAKHAEAHGGAPGGMIGRGETFHLRCTRFFLDPETNLPFPDHAARVAKMTPNELARSRVTRAQVRGQFTEIEERAEGGLYPGAGPRRLFELEMRALREDRDSTVLWMAVSAQNLSVPRRDFIECGGFDEQLTINEHRELALRLCERRGLPVRAVPGARTYHLTHRVGWRDPLTADPEWERAFYRRHPCAATKLMTVFWQSLAGDPHIPEDARILSLEQMDQIVRGGARVDYDALRRAHPQLLDLDG